MITFEGWVDISSSSIKKVSGTYQEGYRAGAKAAWDFFTKKLDAPPPFNPKKLVKNQPPFLGEEDELKFLLTEAIQ